MTWENGEKEREGEEGRKAGRSSQGGKTLKSLPRETNGGAREGDVICPESLGAHTEVATMVTLASYESSQHCAGVVTCLCLL